MKGESENQNESNSVVEWDSLFHKKWIFVYFACYQKL